MFVTLEGRGIRGRRECGPPGGNRRGREKEWKRLESGRSHCCCKGRRAFGSALVTDWPLLLPPCVKTQMACSGWSKGPVSYRLGSAQPLRDSRIALWVGWVGRWGRVGPTGAVGLPRGVCGGQGRGSAKVAPARVPPPSRSGESVYPPPARSRHLIGC